MRRKVLALAIAAAVLLALWHSRTPPSPVPQAPAADRTADLEAARTTPSAAEALLAGYGDPATEPVEDLRKLHRVVVSYFSVIKESSRHPIGGNADLAAALRGENPNQEVFLPADHPVFSPDGLLLDRWDTPLVVHPQAWRELELRSAGPDRTPYTDDDLILAPTGAPAAPR